MNETYFIVIPVDKRVRIEKCDGTLKQMQKLVDGYIEVLPTQTQDSHVLIVDEEGKLKNKPINRAACVIFGTSRGLITGTVILARREGGKVVGFDKELAKSFAECAYSLNS